MPGIVGTISRMPRASWQRDRMLETICHDAGYGKGSWSHGALGIHVGWVAHDAAAADHMPLWNEAGDICLIFSGEEFSEPRVRDDLRRAGHQLGTHGASHVVHLYEEYGPQFLSKLNGGFSGLLVDMRSGTAMLFNDRFGVGRLYIRETADGVFFASEAKALLRLFPDSRKLEHSAVAQTLSFGCVLNNRTLFDGLSLMPPASTWTFDASGLRTRATYFDPKTWEEQSPLSRGEFSDALRAQFESLLPNYLSGSSACAMSLTGGLDGRMVMAWSKLPARTLPCYSFSGPYRESEDVRIARRVADICGQPHSTIVVGDAFLAAFPSLAERCAYVSDGTMDVSGAVELYVNAAARDIAPVRITGNYGSEVVRGNVAFRPRPVLANAFDGEFLKHIELASQTYAQARNSSSDLSFVAFKQVPWHHHARLSVEQSRLIMRSPFLDNNLVSLLYRAPAATRADNAPSLRLIHEGNPALARIATDRGLAYGANSIASRLRQSFQSLTVRAEYAYDYGMPQWLNRIDRTLTPLRLQRFFLGRHKFYHFRTWYRHQLAPYVQEVLLDQRAVERSYFRPKVLARLVSDHVKGRGNYTRELHQALTFELTHRQLLDRWVGTEAA